MAQEIGRRIRGTYRYDTAVWRTAIAGLWIICFLAFSTAVLGIPTGLGKPTDIALAAGAGTVLLAISGNILAVLLALTGLRIPRLFAGCVLSDFGAILLILYYADFEIEAAVVIAVVLALLGALGGLAIGLLRSKRITLGLLLTVAVTFSPLALASGVQELPISESVDINDTEVVPLTASDPGKPGNLAYQTFTYASGTDLHRAEYGKDTSLISSTKAKVHIQ